MASSLQLLFLLLSSFVFSVTFSFPQRPRLHTAMEFPVRKDASTLQYTTHLYQGTSSSEPIKLVVDLGGPFLWIDCTSGHVSSSQRRFHSGSLQCSMAKGNGCFSTTAVCSLNTANPITGEVTAGELAEDTISVDHGSDQLGLISTVDHFLFSCAPTLLLKGLPSGVKGLLGLGRTRIALPPQLAAKVGTHRKFSVCLSSSDGVILIGGRTRGTLPHPEVWKSLMYTPLISNPVGTFEDYYINMQSIKVNGRRLILNESLLSINKDGFGGTKLSTIVPYTTMESTIYETFTKAYVEVATSMNLSRVASVPPFGACFSSNGAQKTPEIDLVLQSEMVKWRIHGRNSVVRVTDEVVCLGFLDGGLSPRASIVIGGYQLEDYLLEFDLATSMLGFSSSLLMWQTSCSDFKMHSTPSESTI